MAGSILGAHGPVFAMILGHGTPPGRGKFLLSLGYVGSGSEMVWENINMLPRHSNQRLSKNVWEYLFGIINIPGICI